MSVGERLARAIEASGLKMTEFSDLAGVPYRSMQNYVAEVRTPKADVLAQICTRMGISADWLLIGTGPIHRVPVDQGGAASPVDPDPVAWHDRDTHDPRFARVVLGWSRWAALWWRDASDDERAWLEIQLRRAFPEWDPGSPVPVADAPPRSEPDRGPGSGG